MAMLVVIGFGNNVLRKVAKVNGIEVAPKRLLLLYGAFAKKSIPSTSNCNILLLAVLILFMDF
jgi:hypothetical protein